MKSKKNIKLLTFLFIGLFTMFISTGCSCTSSMCSDSDIENIKTQIEKNNIEEWRNTAALSGMKVETEEYKAYANAKVEELYLLTDCGKSNTCTEAEVTSVKNKIKSDNNNKWLNELESLSPDDEGYVKTRTDKFQEYVEEQVNSEYEKHPKACLVIEDDIDPKTGAKIEKKTWGDAWSESLLNGLIVYPISWLLSILINAFGQTGFAIIGAIFITVIIIRMLMIITNLKGQIGTIKMQEVQPELNRISEKLRDPNLSQNEKNQLSMKMMSIYKDNNINPFSMILTQFISFPIFIAVWAAMNQTLVIRKGEFLGLQLGDLINTQIFQGNITAIVLFLLMIGGQVVSMKLSTWLKAAKEKKNNPYYKKLEKTDADKQMNTFMIVMLVMVIISGFVLPAALAVYWLFGSIFSIGQTFLFSSEFMKQKLKVLANRKKRVKVVK